MLVPPSISSLLECMRSFFLQAKDYIALVISFIAILMSFYNLYAQQFRRREHLTGSMFSVGLNDSAFDRRLEYVISNTGDVQLAVKQVEVLVADRILKSEVVGVPVILKPGDVALVDVLYRHSDAEGEPITQVEFGVFTARGNCYRLPHSHCKKAGDRNSVWEAFELQKEHEGF